MPPRRQQISLIYFVILALLLVGLVPLVLTGWFLSDKSGRELRAAENRYQIQLVQEKARQIEMFGKRFTNLVSNVSAALELSNDPALLSSAQTEKKLSSLLRENPDLLALRLKPMEGDALSAFRGEVSGTDIDSISDEISALPKMEKLIVGNPRKLASSGEIVMAFAYPVTIRGAKTAEVIALASLRDIN